MGKIQSGLKQAWGCFADRRPAMLVAAVAVLFALSACAPQSPQRSQADQGTRNLQWLDTQRLPVLPAGQVELGRAMDARRGLRHVLAQNLVVVEILPDDVHGRRHQKWVVALADQRRVQVVYNSDFGPRVPVQLGQVQDVAGEYIWNSKGGLLHWTHYDPRGRRPDGFVQINGQIYGDTPPSR